MLSAIEKWRMQRRLAISAIPEACGKSAAINNGEEGIL
jgi:hypothetical protein